MGRRPTAVTPFGRFLRKLRVDKDITAKVMCMDLNISTQYISMVEQGKKKFNGKLVEAISRYFDLDVNQSIEAYRLMDISQPYIKLDLTEASDTDRKLMFKLSRLLDDLPEEFKTRVLNELEELVDKRFTK